MTNTTLEDRLNKYTSPKNVKDVPGTYYDFTFQQARAAITADLLDIVGEDEHDKSVDITYQEWRNELRFELREDIRKYTGVEKIASKEENKRQQEI